eukprot:1143575-Pelagomonas_calceolata.AAC.7
MIGRLAQHRRPSVAMLAKGKKGKGGGGDSDSAPSKGKGGKGGSKDVEDVDGEAIEKEAKADAVGGTVHGVCTGQTHPLITNPICATACTHTPHMLAMLETK